MSGYFTQNLQEDEIVVQLVRKHIALMLRWVVTTLLILLVPLVLVKPLLASGWGTLLFTGLLILGVAFGFYAYVRWYFDSVIITDRRLIHINQRGLFQRDVREVSYERVGDVSYGLHGFLATSLNFGSVTIMLADNETLTFDYLPQPALVQETLKTLVARYQDEHGKQELSAAEFVDIIQETAARREQREQKEQPSEDSDAGSEA